MRLTVAEVGLCSSSSRRSAEAAIACSVRSWCSWRAIWPASTGWRCMVVRFLKGSDGSANGRAHPVRGDVVGDDRPHGGFVAVLHGGADLRAALGVADALVVALGGDALTHRRMVV